MRQVSQLRKVIERRRAAIDAKLAKRTSTTSDSTNLSATQVEQRPAIPASSIQNADGSFVSMTGYDY